jgi:hypothetical protein
LFLAWRSFGNKDKLCKKNGFKRLFRHFPGNLLTNDYEKIGYVASVIQPATAP